jgi:concanavalin A-like lectin/glucanase superfamily protein
MANLGTLSAVLTELGTVGPVRAQLGGLAPLVRDLGRINMPFIPDAILALGPVWAFDALTSLVGFDHLAEVDIGLDLVGSNNAVQADSAIRPLFDATAFNGRGGLYGVDKAIKQYLTAPNAIALGGEYTHVFVWKKRDLCGNFDGFYCMRPDTTGTAGSALVSMAYYGALSIGARILAGPALATAQTYYDITDSPTAEVVHVNQPITAGLGSKDWLLDRQVYERSAVSNTEIASNNPRLGQGYAPSSLSQLNGWISSWYIFDRILSDAEVSIILVDLETRRPSYFRDALPVAWSHFEFRERRADGVVPAETTAVDAAGGIPAGGALTNGVLQRLVMGSESNPVGFSFDGVNDHVELGVGDLDFVHLAGVFTMECFGTLPTLANQWATMVATYDGVSGFRWFRDRSTGNMSFAIFGGTTLNAAEILTDIETPQHLLVTGDGVNLRAYIDGSEVSSIAQGPVGIATTTPPEIGGDPTLGRNWPGKLNEVNFHQATLTPAEIRARTRLYRGDIGQRLIDGFGTGATGIKHLFMMEEIRGETTWVDRITAATGTHNNGPEPGIYTPIRGTTRRTGYDGVNDWSSYLDADWDLDIGVGASFSGFAFLNAGSSFPSGAQWLLGKLGNPGLITGFYLTRTAVTGILQFIVRGPGGIRFMSGTIDVSDQDLFFGFSVNRATGNLSTFYQDMDTGVTEFIELTIVATDMSSAANYDLGASPIVNQYHDLKMGLNGYIQRALSRTELQWIADIGKWS